MKTKPETKKFSVEYNLTTKWYYVLTNKYIYRNKSYNKIQDKILFELSEMHIKQKTGGKK